MVFIYSNAALPPTKTNSPAGAAAKLSLFCIMQRFRDLVKKWKKPTKAVVDRVRAEEKEQEKAGGGITPLLPGGVPDFRTNEN